MNLSDNQIDAVRFLGCRISEDSLKEISEGKLNCPSGLTFRVAGSWTSYLDRFAVRKKDPNTKADAFLWLLFNSLLVIDLGFWNGKDPQACEEDIIGLLIENNVDERLRRRFESDLITLNRRAN